MPTTSTVLLPPIGLDKGTWAPGGVFDVAAIRHEYPGHGSRELSSEPLSLAGLADELVNSYDGLLDLIGVSFGGMIALNTAIRHPDRIRSLVVACSGASADPLRMRQRADALIAQGVSSVMDETLRRWFTAEALAAKPEHTGVAYVRQTLNRLDPAVFADAWLAIGRHDVRRQLGEITQPVTCIAGTRDEAASVERLDEIARGVQHGRLVVIEGPHMLQLECPDEFERVVAEHLRQLTSA